MKQYEDSSKPEGEKPVDFFRKQDVLGMELPSVKQVSRKEEETNEQKTQISVNTLSMYQPIWKFCVLCIISFGLYEIIWFYNNWRYLRDEKQHNIIPVWRAMLILFFGYSLFRTFTKLANEKGYHSIVPSGFLFLLYIGLKLISQLSDFPFLMRLPSFILLIPIVNRMNYYYENAHPEHRIAVGFTKEEKQFIAVYWFFLILMTLIALF